MNKMMRSIIMVCGAVLAATTLLSGCSIASSNENGDVQESAANVERSEGDELATESASEQFKPNLGSQFSDGRAWVYVILAQDGERENAYACIDKAGTVRFLIPVSPTTNNFSCPTPFKDGYSYLLPISGISEEGYKSIGIVDIEGHVTLFGDEENVLVVAYGGGYVVLERHESDFDSNTYIYEIRDARGNLVETLSGEESSEPSPVRYCGQGVFWFQSYPNDGDVTSFYCCESRTLVEESATQEVEFVDGSDIALIAMSNSGEMKFLSSDGRVTVQPLPEGASHFQSAKVSDGLCVLEADGLVSVEVATGRVRRLPDEYAQRINSTYLGSEPATFYDGRCVLPAKGDDGEWYFQVFDADWNLVFGPIQAMIGESSRYSDDVLSVDGKIYDLQGNVLFSNERDTLASSDGTFICADHLDPNATYGGINGEGNLIYLNEKGEQLFEQLTFTSESKTIELPEWNS